MNEDAKKYLFKKLKKEHCFWSYDPKSVTFRNLTDDMLIYKTLVHLDIEEINLLFKIYGKEKIQEVWERELAIQGDYYRRLNKFLAYIYFDITEPEKYLKKIQRRHIKNITNTKIIL